MSGPSRLDLSDLGITEEQAAKARRLAALSDSDYEWFKRLRLSEEGFSFGDIFEAFFGAEPEITTSRENGSRRRPRGYAEWRPQAKTRRLLAQVEEILEEYEQQLPLTVRQIFYRLVGARLRKDRAGLRPPW